MSKKTKFFEACKPYKINSIPFRVIDNPCNLKN